MSNPAEQAMAAVRELHEAVGWLAATLVPGTHKPYRAPTISPEQRAERDRDARLERLERVGIAPGETPAPVDLDVADLLVETLTTVDELCDRACIAANEPAPPAASSAFADPAPFLDALLRTLPAAVLEDVALALDVERACDSLVYRTHALLGLLGDGQVLAALCPWCGGRTATAPVGGAKTLRVRAQLPAGKRSVAGVDPADVTWYVVCEGECAPPEADCGTWLRGRPAWPLGREGQWLADRLERAAELSAQVEAIVKESA